MTIEVLFSPAEFVALKQRDLSQATCVVFDILRATTSMTAALANGAARVIPVTEISEAIALRQKNPGFLLAGEREGVRILAAQTGGVDFDLGNSPREFVAEKVRGKTIVMTTTNGTRALQACLGANAVFIGTFLNLDALARRCVASPAEQLILVCAGTFAQTAFEDALAAGALCQKLARKISTTFSDSAFVAQQIFLQAGNNLFDARQFSRNARRLLAQPELCGDVEFCLQRDTVDWVAGIRPGIPTDFPSVVIL